MSIGDYGLIFKWIEDLRKSGQIRRAEKLGKLKQELDDVELQINAERIKTNPNYVDLQFYIDKQHRLQKRIQSFAR